MEIGDDPETKAAGDAQDEMSPTDRMIGPPPMGWADRRDVMRLVRDIHRVNRQQATRVKDGNGDL